MSMFGRSPVHPHFACRDKSQTYLGMQFDFRYFRKWVHCLFMIGSIPHIEARLVISCYIMLYHVISIAIMILPFWILPSWWLDICSQLRDIGVPENDFHLRCPTWTCHIFGGEHDDKSIIINDNSQKDFGVVFSKRTNDDPWGPVSLLALLLDFWSQSATAAASSSIEFGED